MDIDTGRSPDGSGHSAEPEPCSTVSAVPASVPNAVHTVAVSLSRHDGGRVLSSIIQSWHSGTREQAIVHALEYAQGAKPGFQIDQWLVAKIPLPVIQIDDGARTAPRYAAEIVRKAEPGRSGLVWNLERLADHLDACASAIEARRAIDAEGGVVVDESAASEAGDAQ